MNAPNPSSNPNPSHHGSQKPALVYKPTPFMILLGYFTPLYLLSGILIILSIGKNGLPGFLPGLCFALFWLYLIPPLLARLTLRISGFYPEMITTHHSRDYKIWWLLTQYQMVFNRFPFLEELLRLVPGVYALWLNLWGSRVSPYAFWSPGAYVTDRYLLHIGYGCIIGSRSLLSAHLITQTDNHYQLTVAPITLENQCICGFNSVIGPGCRIGAGETFPADRALPPFTAWLQGKRVPLTQPPANTTGVPEDTPCQTP